MELRESMVPGFLPKLYAKLRSRPRPEDVAKLIHENLPACFALDVRLAGKLKSLSGHADVLTSMGQDFFRPIGGECFRKSAAYLFPEASFPENALDRDALLQYVTDAGSLIYRRPFQDYKRHRLNREGRQACSMEYNRFQYNRRFRLLVRIEEKMATLAVTLEMEKLAVAANSRLAWEIPERDFMADSATACYVTYLASRLARRSVFTCGPQESARDEISEAILKLLENRPETRWDVVAHVDPRPSVCERLTEAEKLYLLDTYMQVMQGSAKMLSQLLKKFRLEADSMVVKQGDDSTNWNLAAGAWNKTRDGWIALVQALGSENLFEEFLPGKAQRLIAGDVAAWHMQLGKKLDPNTAVWAELPRPWDVMLQGATCTRPMIAAACARHGMDPVKSGWIAARATFVPAKFSPTPELVHGVVVRSAQLATYLRKMDVYSGKSVKDDKTLDAFTQAAALETLHEHRSAEEQRTEPSD